LNAACSSGSPRGAQAVGQSKVLQQDPNLGGKGNLGAGGGLPGDEEILNNESEEEKNRLAEAQRVTAIENWNGKIKIFESFFNSSFKFFKNIIIIGIIKHKRVLDFQSSFYKTEFV